SATVRSRTTRARACRCTARFRWSAPTASARTQGPCLSACATRSEHVMDFTLSSELLALQRRTRDFIREQIIPLERETPRDPHGPSEAVRREVVARAQGAGLLTPHASREMGGLGLSHVEKAIVFEEAGYSWLGPTALNIHAPDEGNIHLMEEVATPAQK